MKEFWNNLKFVWTYTKDKKSILIKYIIGSIFIIIISILIPLITSQIVIYLTKNNFSKLLTIALIAFFLQCLYNLIKMLNTRYMQTLRRSSYTKIQTDLGKNTLKLTNNSLEENSSGVFIQRLTGDTTELSVVFETIVEYSTIILSKVGIYISIFILNKIIFFYLVLVSIIMYIIEITKSSKVKEKDEIFRNKNERNTGFVGELVRGLRDIKMLNAEKSFISSMKSSITTTNESRYEIQHIRRKYQFVSDITWTISIIGMLLLIALFIYTSNLSAAAALIIFNFSDGIFSLIYVFSNLLENIKSFNLSCNRIYEVIDSDKFKKENFGTTHLPHINGDFEFKNVHFSYGKEKVLKGINFKVNANETVAFVGKSGAGKTTIFNLLCKMYESQKGTITIDGKNIKKLDKDTIRGNITIISQNPYIFNMTIRENLNLVKENLTEDEMFEACKLACLHDYIMTLPDKYDTVIGEGGVNLSGGQKQRLAIARAFVQKTEIILFDEATSALDNETQSKIQKAIENMKKDYTILIIAHRLSTIINADRILYIEDGIVKSEGTHKELLKKCEGYKQLYTNEIKNRE